MKLPITTKLSALFLGIFIAGCAYFPLRPGIGTIQSATGGGAFVRQSQNPQQASEQSYEKTSEVVLPGTNAGSILRTTERGTTHIGAAQKDTARDMAAKLGSLKSVVWVGLLVFLFGAASFVYPPVKLLVGGSVTTSAVITGSGLALIVLPSLLIGHELLILGVAFGAAGLYWFAHRHGSLAGALQALKDDAGKVIKKVESDFSAKPTPLVTPPVTQPVATPPPTV
jgi:hypothetical protein